MQNQKFIKIDARDNVAVAVSDVPRGESFEGVSAIEKIPQAHKMALCPIKKDDAIIRYGVVIGYADKDLAAGEWVNENKTYYKRSLDLSEIESGKNIRTDLPKAPVQTFMGYENPNGGYAGTRNLLGIVTTVQCVTGVLNIAVQKMKAELLPKYPNVEDIVPINHAYGCGVAIAANDADVPIRTIRNIIKNPNFGGEIMVVGLGCEKLRVEMVLDEKDINEENVIILQDKKGFADMIDSLMEMAEKKLKKLNERKRVELPLSKLCVGMQCGGSDAFSGISANPAAGYAADLLVQAGGTVMFSEVTEVRDTAAFVGERCVTQDVCDKFTGEMAWYDQYLEKGGVDRGANTTPGNKMGGLSNIIEKSLGSVAKSGTSPIVEVLAPAEIPTKHGLIYAATPASDFVCGPCQLASGITLQVFMTGRGTPYGLAVAPVIKVCSRNEVKDMWSDLIDINAGSIASGEATVAEVGEKLFMEIVDVASGRKKTCAEKYKLYNDFCLFNPAPIT